MLAQTKRLLWFCVGLVALALAAAGIVLPLLPTTPFLLVAAYAFARSSERLHDWLVTHRLFGPLIRDWRERGVISRRAKQAAIGSMGVVFAISVVLRVPVHALVIQAVVLAASATFILTRPDH